MADTGVHEDGKPDLFEMGCLELLAAYKRLWKQGEFAWPVISSALDHVVEATKLLDKASKAKNGG